MQPLTIINDVHIGAQRSAGTTPLTAWQLRQYLLEEFERLVVECDGPLLILGDLFDTGHIPMADLLATWRILSDHLQKGHELILVAGNHDYEKTLTTLSSFQFLCRLLEAQHKQCLQVVEQPTEIPRWGIHVIPHMPNQDLFDAALVAAPECQHLLVHCNYDNKFAVQSDHSLNMTLDQAMRAKCKHVVFAHEHQQKTALGGKVVIIGNQIPSSISDCLGNTSKNLLCLSGPDVFWAETWTAQGNYVESDWRSLGETNHKFIRVVGEASAAEAAEVVSAISKFRNKSKALVITNAVQIEGAADGEQIKVSLEEVKSFDVLGALLECLDEREQGVVKKLLGEAA